MADETSRSAARDQYVRGLAKETGLSEEKIREIINMIGLDRGSIIREARILKALDRKPP